MIFTSKVPGNILRAAPLSEYLASRFTYHSKEDWERKILEGRLRVNGEVAGSDSTISAGSTIDYNAEEFEEPPANLDYAIIYEDQWFLGVNKPGNLLVHRAGSSFRNNLIYQIRYVNKPSFPEAHTAHRLDRDTSGVVIVAKESQARAAIGKAFSESAVRKEYAAIVHGIPPETLVKIDMPIGKSVSSSISYKFDVNSEGKPAVTLIKKVMPIGSSCSLLTLQPLTGRTHQIRIHLSYSGYPIVGDKLYGMEESKYLQWRDNPCDTDTGLLFYRHALHCKEIEFLHPFLQKKIKIGADIPEDMKLLIEKLRGE
jgi:RluA family pseudouridine synthase